MLTSQMIAIDVGERIGRVPGLWLMPSRAQVVYVLAHGAGAGMTHTFLGATAVGLAERGVGSLRYQFPYMEQRRGRPDKPAVATATVRAAVRRAGELTRGLPLIAGGKSFGGRMTSTAQAADPLPGVRGLAFLGFPLHQPGRPSRTRGDHLDAVRIPLLFLQGTRDEFADLDVLRPLCAGLGERATLRVIDGADHSFHVLKRSGRNDATVLHELLDTIAAWAAQVTG